VVKPPYDTLGAPWQSGLRQDAQPLRAGEPVRLQFALTPTARVIKAGHRLRVVLTGADPRQRNLAELQESPAPLLTLWRGKSAVELPLRAPTAH
jgi:predicted acyl esterase